MKYKNELYILLAGFFWGIIGLFTQLMARFGINSNGVLIIRSGGCFLLFFLTMLIRNPDCFRINLRDFGVFLLFGIATASFTYCYYRAIASAGLGVGCTLMYSAPVFVMVISLFLFKEKFTVQKLVALFLSLSGCIFVSGILNSKTIVNFSGILFGFLSAIGYALYSIFSKILNQKGYSSLQINTYGWLIAFLLACIFVDIKSAIPMFDSLYNFSISFGLILFSGFLPAFFYNHALAGTEASKASVMVSIEPVISSLTGILVFHEEVTLSGVLGILLVISSVIIINQKANTDQKTEDSLCGKS